MYIAISLIVLVAILINYALRQITQAAAHPKWAGDPTATGHYEVPLKSTNGRR